MKKISVVLGLVMLVVALMAAWLPGPALAASSLTLSNLRLTPTYECLGVRVTFTGAPAVDGAAVLEYRPTGGTWKTAFPMYCDILGGEFRGSIFWLSPNTTYEVRVTGSNVVSGTVTTRNDNPASIGNTYYVSPSGSDSNAGSLSAPWKTITKAAGVVNPGDTVILRAGTYVGGFSITRSGTATNYITFKGADGETAILDGQSTNYNILDISGSYIRIKNLTFQNNKNADTDDAACLRMLSNSDCIVEDCTMQNGNGLALCMIRNGAKNMLFQRLTWIMNKVPVNTYGDNGVPGGITGGYWWKAGGGNVWRNINITATVSPGIWDGFGGGPEDTLGYMEDTDVYNITLNQPPIVGTWDRDDSVQPEGSSINVRVWNVVTHDSFCGLACAGCRQGPVYFFRNTLYGFAESMLKCGDHSYGRLYFINNTAYTTNGGRGFKQSNGYESNYFVRNNIIISDRFTELNSIVDTTNTVYPVCKTINLDYDFVWSTGDKFMEFYSPTDGSGASTWSGLQSIGMETHGINQQDPKFVNVTGLNFSLASGSPCIDKGVVLTQFNDANSPWPYQGSAPDIGAFEYAGGTSTNNAPVLNTIGNQSVAAGQSITFTLSATSPSGNSLTYSASNLPSGAIFNTNTKTFSWTPSSTQTGTYTGIQFQVSDGTLTDTESVTIVVSSASNSAPVLSAIGNKTVTAGQALTFTISATDADGNTLTYSASNLPSGATFNSNTKAFSWTPSSTQTGTFTGVHFQVSDGTLTAAEDITITVNAAANHAPVLSAIGNKTVTAGQALTFTISATDADGNTLTYSATNLPSGATFNGNTRTFSWTPSSTQTGTYTGVHFQVSDGALTASEDITITVNSTSTTNQLPVIASIGNKTVNEAQAISFTVSATDPDGDTLTYSASNLPSGAAFNASTKAFSWTPSYAQAGTYSNVSFTVNDGHQNVSQVITVTVVNVPRAPVMNAIGNKSGTVGQSLAFTVTATDPDGGALTYSASNLPSGASFSASTKSFSWKPGSAQCGTFSGVHFQVSNGALSDAKDISITVSAASTGDSGTSGSGGTGTSGTSSSASTFGISTGNGVWYQGSDALCASKFVNTSGTGTLTKLEILFSDKSARGKVRLGVYADDNGKPGALLLDAGEVNIVNGWASKSGLSLPVTAGQSYWLAFNLNYAVRIKTQSNYGPTTFYWFNTAYGPLMSQFPTGDGYGCGNDVYVMRATVTP